MSEKKKRINLTTAEKIDILDRIKTGETRQALCNETGVGLRTIERWVHNEKGLREEALTRRFVHVLLDRQQVAC